MCTLSPFCQAAAVAALVWQDGSPEWDRSMSIWSLRVSLWQVRVWAPAAALAVGLTAMLLSAGFGGEASTPQLEVSGSAAAEVAAAGIDLNHATAAELQQLPGIGTRRAEQIVAARQLRPFVDLRDAYERGLIPERTLEEIAAQAVVLSRR